TRSERSTSIVKSTWPGVSIRWISCFFHSNVVAAAVIVIPRSRSCSIQSISVSPSWTSPTLWIFPEWNKKRSDTVVLPASMWATTPRLRTRSILAMSLAGIARNRRDLYACHMRSSSGRSAMWLQGIAAGLLAGTAGIALGQPGPDFAKATELYRQATAELADGKYAEAVRDYGAAYDITKDPVLFYKIG